MSSELIFGIVSSLIAILLTINAYFIKELLQSLNQVKLQTAILIEKSNSSESRLSSLERHEQLSRERMHDIINEFGGRVGKLEMRVFDFG